MADRPCRLRLRDCLLTALLLSSSITAHAVGIATPQVMSGFNEPLKARVALLDTGTLRASDIRVTLADSDRWQAMDIMRSADTDTLQLSVNGAPGHLYLEVAGSRALQSPWLDVVLTLRWPQGELTPQLTLLPASDAAAVGKLDTAIASSEHRATSGALEGAGAPANNTGRADSMSRPARDDPRVAMLEARLERLEQQLRNSQQSQAALTADLEAVRAEALVDRPPPDNAGMQTLALRQQALEAPVDQLNQEVPAPDVTAPAVVSAPAEASIADVASPRDASPQVTSVQAPASEPPGLARNNSFVWVYALAALALLLTGAWALVRRWRQARYRLVSAAELSPLGDAYASAGDAPATDADEHQQQMVGSESDDAWAGHREHIDAICNEAEVFERHNRRDHAITMLREGLEQYPNDFQLIRALAALEAASESVGTLDSHDDSPSQPLSVSSVTESPTLAPHWSLKPGVADPGIIDSAGGDNDDIASGRAMNFASTPTAAFPQGWALEEVAFEAVDTDNERPHADRLSRHA